MLTPLDIQNKEFKRAMRGYNMEEVDQFLEQVVRDYEAVYLENQMLKEKLEASEAARTRYQEMEKVIKDTIIIAQKNAEELRNNAKREVELILEEARLRAEKMHTEAGEKATRIVNDAREQARSRVGEAEDRVRSILEEYRFLETQTRVFRVKLRAFLEAQLKILDGQEEEAHDIMLNAGLGIIQAASGQEERFTPVAAGEAQAGYAGEPAGEELPEKDDKGHTPH